MIPQTNNQLLTKEELAELTGSSRTRKQAEILSNHGIRFIKNAKGNIKTTWNAVNSALKSSETNEEDQPNLDWMRR